MAIQDDNLEIFSLIWLDNSVNQSSENFDCQRKLRASINYLKTFDDNNQCEQYIRNLSQNDRLILIVSGRLGQQILPCIHNLQQVIAIYVYCIDKETNEQWTKQFFKVKSVITRLEDLVQQIQVDQKKREQDKMEHPFLINFYNPNFINAQSITGPNSLFIQSQLIIDYLLGIQLNETNKRNLITLCKDKYENNDTELRIIQEFKHTYSSTRSLSWYTRNCFLNRILNKAFQIQNISLLLDLLFFIQDIQQQIEINKSSSIHHVYHCQLISKEEFEILNQSIGQFISINTFLSTTPDRQQALSIFQDYQTSNNIFKVLFEIDTNPQYHNIYPFADITSLSYNSNIKQILFMIGTIFRIENHSRDDKNGIIIISLTRYTKPIFDNLKNEYITNKKTLLSFGHLLFKLNRYDDAEKCYYHLIKNFPDDHKTIPLCYHALGNLASNRDDYDTSLEWHEKSLDIKKNTLSEYDPSLAYSYNSIAAVYHQIGDYQHALELYKQALDIWKKEYNDNHLSVAICYNNIGLVYEEIEKYSEALDCYQQVLNIRQKILPNDHIELGNIYQNLGTIYQSLGQFDLALKYFNQSLLIFEKSGHPNIATIHKNIRIIYEKQSQFQDALSNYQQAQLLSNTYNDINQDVMITVDSLIEL